MTRSFQMAIIFLTAATWLGFAGFLGFPTTWWEATKPFFTAASVSALIVFTFEKRMWSWIIFRGWLTKTPDYRGVWKVRFLSSWIDPETNELVGPLYGFVQIDQTATSFCMRMYTSKAHSKSVAHSIRLDQEVFTLALVYENKPSIRLRETQSSMHLGSVTFQSRGYFPQTLNGEYWTERKTTGEIKLFERKKGEISSFEEGQKLFP